MKPSPAPSGRPQPGRPKASPHPTPQRIPARLVFGVLLAAAWIGVVLQWRLGAGWLDAAIGVLVLVALWVGRRQPLRWRAGVVLALVFPAWRLLDRPPKSPLPDPKVATVPASTGVPAPVPAPAAPPDDDAIIRAVVAAEETHLVLAGKLRRLSADLLDLRLPGTAAGEGAVFAPTVTVRDLGPAPASAGAPGLGAGGGIPEAQSWPLAASEASVTRVDLWRSLLEAVSFFEHAKLHLTDGEHPGGDRWRFESAAVFDALARMTTGEWRAFRGALRLTWERPRTADGGAGEWQITGWRTEALESRAGARRYFAETLDAALPPPEDPRALRRSQHYEATLKYYREGMKEMPHPYFAPISVNQKEGIAIADVNGDGFDDIYITVRLGKNLLLVNQRDGTFAEQAGVHRLDLPGHTTCALFADFDNDGDRDVLLGRSLLRTSYLENRGGWYFQHPIPPFMPMAVISMAAADYNGDGLLDVYLCTYRPAPPAGSGTAGGYSQVAREGDFDWPDEFFSPELAREFRRRLAEHKQRHGVTVLDQLGPPNVLLVNRGGGRFEPAPENDTVGLWRNSLQATWCDYNGDGRPDLYIPNDWGLNVLFRNDGPAGFTDVTQEAGLTYYGFSMGASWGDYDNDGREDLYISNMFSEAGRRITSRITGLNPMFAESAMGNWLYHGEPGGRFTMVAGAHPPAMTVMQVGWSWGGCFADFNNDAYLDLYVLSGYYTAPRELASGLDLESNLWRTMVRSDENLARPSFRFSPEWRRTSPPDNLGPQIDARLAGVERQGDRLWVHSLHGGERNRYFANHSGRAFVEVSGLSGLDHPADSRGFGLLDYDRDGWLDVALVNANQPLFNLYRNEMPAAGFPGGILALRFVGGNRTPAPTNGLACRDGYGARVTVDLGDLNLVREHRCGEGWSVQNSATMLLGIGARSRAAQVSVRWPSGRTLTTADVPEGTLLTVYENPSDSPSGEAFTRETYRVALPARPSDPRPGAGPVFPLHALDPAAPPARLRVYLTFASSSASFLAQVPALQRLTERLRPDDVDVVAVPVEEAEDPAALAEFARQWNPAWRLFNLPAGRRAEAATAFARTLGPSIPMPSAVITDESGRLLAAQHGLPNLSTLRRLLPERP